jgi:hypothetical protein
MTTEMTMAEKDRGAGNDAGVLGTKRRIVLSGPTKRRVDQTGLAKALGAAEVEPIEHAADTPLGFVAVRQTLLADRRSTGGRPGFADADRRKIPIPASVWRVVSDAAADMSEPGFHPSPAQVASAILSVAVHHLTPDLRRDAKHALKASRSLRSKDQATSD